MQDDINSDLELKLGRKWVYLFGLSLGIFAINTLTIEEPHLHWTYLITKNHSELHESSLFFLIYCSMTLLFPPRIHAFAFFANLLAFISGLYFGPWPIALALTAFMSFILHCFMYGSPRFGTLVSFLLLLSTFSSSISTTALIKYFSAWYVAIYMILLILGLFLLLGCKVEQKEAQAHEQASVPQPKQQQRNRKSDKKRARSTVSDSQTARVNVNAQDTNRSNTTKQHVEATSAQTKKTTQHQKTATSTPKKQREENTPAENLAQIVALHRQSMNTLSKIGDKLPAEFSQLIQSICEQAGYIIHCMENDVRDILPGDKFLTRYLEMAISISHNLSLLTKRALHQPKYQTGLAQGKATLEKLCRAFKIQHQRLLENNLDDLVVDSGVVDKLLKMEGFDDK